MQQHRQSFDHQSEKGKDYWVPVAALSTGTRITITFPNVLPKQTGPAGVHQENMEKYKEELTEKRNDICIELHAIQMSQHSQDDHCAIVQPPNEHRDSSKYRGCYLMLVSAEAPYLRVEKGLLS